MSEVKTDLAALDTEERVSNLMERILAAAGTEYQEQRGSHRIIEEFGLRSNQILALAKGMAVVLAEELDKLEQR